ncbi:SMR family transporter [Bacillus mexicanus]|uniref:SMR family multidrug efflux transporter EbrA n=1 Tax=Bacillus TaxID=1386 RepID=UPI00138A2650|nr:QacE family quaternary ammonium compound efflux SMR transporter [Bacillus sp. SKDU12]
MLLGYIFLTIAICSETLGAAMLKMSDGFKKWKPGALVVIGYSLSFYMLSLTLKYIPLSLSYATWSGVGTVLAAVIGVKWFKEELNAKGLIGILLLLSGVVLLNWQ